MFCPKCTEEIDDNSKFCSNCGYKIPDKKTKSQSKKTVIYCKNCGQKNDVNEKFCTNCMAKLNGKEHDSEYNEPKNGVGFSLGIFLGLIGLVIGLCLYPFGSVSRKTFINSWGIGFFVWVCVFIIVIISCTIAIK